MKFDLAFQLIQPPKEERNSIALTHSHRANPCTLAILPILLRNNHIVEEFKIFLSRLNLC